jgi:Rieske Fe-S protein
LVVGAAPILAACGSDEQPQVSGRTSQGLDSPPANPEPTTPAKTTPRETGRGTTQPEPTETTEPAEPAPEGEPVAAVKDIPVGGGIVVASENLVVTQPSQGQFRGFSATCTHRGCTVAGVADGTINCPCHGSMYSVEDGSVRGGAAPAPLPERTIVRAGQEILLPPQ